MTKAEQARRMAWRFKSKIADYLKRFHQIALAVSSVHRILVRHGMNRLPGSQKHRSHAKRWQRYEKPQPGHRLQMDVKLLERIPGTRKRLYQFTAIDDCTRVRVLTVYDASNQATAIRFVIGAPKRCGHIAPGMTVWRTLVHDWGPWPGASGWRRPWTRDTAHHP